MPSRQTTLAELGRRSLAGAPTDELLREAATTLAREMGADQVAILERTLAEFRDSRLLPRPDGQLVSTTP